MVPAYDLVALSILGADRDPDVFAVAQRLPGLRLLADPDALRRETGRLPGLPLQA